PCNKESHVSPRYFYSVWLRHLVRARHNGLSANPCVVAELGPGYSLGSGLAALISGADKYYAFDVVERVRYEKEFEVFDKIAGLFQKEAPIPDGLDFPELKPPLESYEFSKEIFTAERLKKAMAPERLKVLRQSILSTQNSVDNPIRHFVPWDSADVLEKESVDMVFSQAVLEHVEDLEHVYRSLYYWLKPGGFMSHQIDFKCHGTARQWNGHWGYSDALWGLMKGKRPYLINREPLSAHLRLVRKIGFKMVSCTKFEGREGISRQKLSPKFESLTDEDLRTSGVFFQVVKI
ncbi:MAG TPA: methyltransferase domain-containing protein, partial [bacterium]|nr:methyltransferase domain-containing protein [bacterium]